MKRAGRPYILLLVFIFCLNLSPAWTAAAPDAATIQAGDSNSGFSSLKDIPESVLNIEPLARVGDWVYYLSPCSPQKWRQAELFRAKLDGSDVERVLAGPLGPRSNLKFIGGWIYYTRAGKLCRIRLDGTSYTQLADRVNQYEVMAPYIIYEYVDGLYRIDLDGKNRLLLDGGVNDYYVSRIEKIEGTFIYYQRLTKETNDLKNINITYFTYGLYQINSSGTHKTALAQHTLRGGPLGSGYPTPLRVAMTGNAIYYANNETNKGTVWAVNKNGGPPRQVCTNHEVPDPNITDLFVHNNWLYYTYSYLKDPNQDVLSVMCKVKTDGSSKTRLKADFKLSIYPDDYSVARALSTKTSVGDGWIYYATLHEIYRIRIDGSEKTRIYDAGAHNIYWMELRGDYLFFNWIEESSTFQESVWRCRVKTDGGNFAKVEGP